MSKTSDYTEVLEAIYENLSLDESGKTLLKWGPNTTPISKNPDDPKKKPKTWKTRPKLGAEASSEEVKEAFLKMARYWKKYASKGDKLLELLAEMHKEANDALKLFVATDEPDEFWIALDQGNPVKRGDVDDASLIEKYRRSIQRLTNATVEAERMWNHVAYPFYSKGVDEFSKILSNLGIKAPKDLADPRWSKKMSKKSAYTKSEMSKMDHNQILSEMVEIMSHFQRKVEKELGQIYQATHGLKNFATDPEMGAIGAKLLLKKVVYPIYKSSGKNTYQILRGMSKRALELNHRVREKMRFESVEDAQKEIDSLRDMVLMLDEAR